MNGYAKTSDYMDCHSISRARTIETIVPEKPQGVRTSVATITYKPKATTSS